MWKSFLITRNVLYDPIVGAHKTSKIKKENIESIIKIKKVYTNIKDVKAMKLGIRQWKVQILDSTFHWSINI